MFALIVQVFPSAERQHEFLFCLRHNLNVPEVTHIFNLIESEEHRLTDTDIAGHPKYREITWGKRLRYADAFDFARKHGTQGDLWAVVNADIALDPKSKFTNFNGGWPDAPDIAVVQCLSRLDWNPWGEGAEPYWDKRLSTSHGATAQDMWMFRLPLRDIPDANFPVGNCPGCDNAIANRFLRGGYLPVNDSVQYRILHVHRSYQESTEPYKGNAGTDWSLPEKRGYWLVPRVDTPFPAVPCRHWGMYWDFCDFLHRWIHISNTVTTSHPPHAGSTPSPSTPAAVPTVGLPDQHALATSTCG